MSVAEVALLESLFHKMEGELKHRIALCSGIQDSINIGVYDAKTGRLIHSQDGATLLTSVDKLKRKINETVKS